MKGTLDFLSFIIVFLTTLFLLTASIIGLCMLGVTGHYVVLVSILIPPIVWAFWWKARRE